MIDINSYQAGEKRISGEGSSHEYGYFLPSLINQDFQIKNNKILITLENATRLLGELNVYGNLIPDIDFFIRMHEVAEAVCSSKIEGTKTEIDDILLSQEEIYPERRDDWEEVNNYIQAMKKSIEELENLPISIRLMKKAHSALLTGVRGENKEPGTIRKSQNWIGGNSINTAHFVPPHEKHLKELLSDWEKFWHNQDLNIPILIKIALGHYQLETIHPFLDGNGRIGRLFISLQLIEKKFLKYPILYISKFFEKNRQSYYDNLDRVRSNNDIEGWLLFFLEGIIKTATESQATFKNILKLRADWEEQILSLSRKAKNGKRLLNYLFSHPIVSVKQVAQDLKMDFHPANALIKDFVKLGILKEKTNFSRNRIFALEDYIKLFR